MVKKELLLKLIRNKSNSQINTSLPKRELKRCGEKLEKAKVLKVLEWEFE